MIKEYQFIVGTPNKEAISEVTNFYRGHINIFFMLNYVLMEVIEFVLNNKSNDKE